MTDDKTRRQTTTRQRSEHRAPRGTQSEREDEEPPNKKMRSPSHNTDDLPTSNCDKIDWATKSTTCLQTDVDPSLITRVMGDRTQGPPRQRAHNAELRADQALL